MGLELMSSSYFHDLSVVRYDLKRGCQGFPGALEHWKAHLIVQPRITRKG